MKNLQVFSIGEVFRDSLNANSLGYLIIESSNMTLDSYLCEGTANTTYDIVYWDHECLRDASYLGIDTSIPELENFFPIGGYGNALPFLSESNTLYIWEVNATAWEVFPLPSDIIDTSYIVGQFCRDAIFITDDYSVCVVLNLTTRTWTDVTLHQESNHLLYLCWYVAPLLVHQDILYSFVVSQEYANHISIVDLATGNKTYYPLPGALSSTDTWIFPIDTVDIFYVQNELLLIDYSNQFVLQWNSNWELVLTNVFSGGGLRFYANTTHMVEFVNQGNCSSINTYFGTKLIHSVILYDIYPVMEFPGILTTDNRLICCAQSIYVSFFFYSKIN